VPGVSGHVPDRLTVNPLKRPFFKKSIEELQAMVDGPNPPLREVRRELAARSTRKSRELLNRIERTLKANQDRGMTKEDTTISDKTPEAKSQPDQDDGGTHLSHLDPDDPRTLYADSQIARLRQRLLDLSKRNTLLNYRFTDRARGQLRIIDEVPDRVYTRLQNADQMWFKALEQPKDEPEDERTDRFIAALEAARFESPEYRQALDNLGEDAPDAEQAKIERALKDQVRLELKMPPRPDRKTMSRSEVARLQGLDPSYDLAAAGLAAVPAPKHTDSHIQTLLFPDEMERKLSVLRDIYSKGLEETGLNTLFAVYGFLEWYETDISDEKLFSPLLLQPLEMSRSARGDEYRYAIKSTGEETAVNLTLLERLKEARIVLPEFTEEDTPSAYMRKVTGAVAGRNRWRVHSYVSVGIFSFGKLVMWHDLDPARWPTHKSLASHPIVASLLAGRGFTGMTDAEDYPVDTPEFNSRLPLLVTDADASQLSAVIDAVEGQSLAIKGPPGTGKSQTITNLIAAALAKGKSVLFVAEKMAALEVVKKRLDQFDLGEFVLELHSTKSKKKDVLQSVADRLELSREKPPSRLAGASDELRRLKLQLTEYADLLNNQIGKCGKSLQEVFWAEARTRKVSLPKALDQLRLVNAENLNYEDLTRVRGVMTTVQTVWSEVISPFASATNHPWYGIRKILPAFEQEALIDKIKEWNAALVQVERLENSLIRGYGALQGLSEAGLNVLAEHILALPTSEELALARIPPELLKLLANPEIEKQARDINNCWGHIEDLDRDLAAYFHNLDAGIPDPKDLHACASTARALKAIGFKAGEVGERLAEIKQEQKACNEFRAVISRLAALTQVAALDTHADIGLVRQTADIIRSSEARVLAGRHAALFSDEAAEILKAGRMRADGLKQSLREIGLEFRAVKHLQPHALRNAAEALLRTSFIARPFSASFKKALSLQARIFGKSKVKRQAAAEELERLAGWLDDVERFELDRNIAKVAGPWFAGIETDFETVDAVRAFEKRAQTLKRAGGVGPALYHFAISADEERLGTLTEMVLKQSALIIDEGLKTLLERNETASSSAARLENLVRDWEDFSECILILRIRSDAKLSQLELMATTINRRQEILNREMADLQPVVETLAELGFTQAASDLRATALDLTSRLKVADSIADSDMWRAKVFVGDVQKNMAALRDEGIQLRSALKLLGDIGEYAQDFGDLDVAAVFDSRSRRDSALGVVRAWTEDALRQQNILAGWMSWLVVRADACDEGLEDILSACDQHGGYENLPAAFERVFWRSLVRKVFDEHPTLARFSGMRQEEVRRRFRELDHELLKMNRKQLRADLLQIAIPSGIAVGPKSSWTDKAALQNHSSLQRPRIAIRKLISVSHRALKACKPCWMMSPGSVAQFLPQGAVEFDLVVIDEASQMKPEDAIGAAARGHQIIVVGDPMQLPPTSFFDKVDAFDDDDEEDVEAESVLDLALSVYQPARHLTWHYRSRHQSLIAFSNKEFYDGKLVVFPSPEEKSEELGVTLRKVNGIYHGRGGNRDEVKALAEAALKHMRNFPHLSLGVVAVNREQTELLRGEIERLILHDEKAQHYVATWESTIEPLFIKNLETVQGDERDVIMISVVYGPNEEGRVMQRFGPINSKVGHRRLNVLFTRAKRRVELFTSMTAADILPGDNTNWGVLALKRYLEYAATGRLETGDEGGGEPDSDFEMFVAEALSAKGYQVRTQVGVAGYRIDLGIKHPAYPHGYLLGVECDGASYHSAKCVRDRDALRQEVLEGLGWKLYRVWSTDWFHDPQREIDKLTRHIEQLRRTRPVFATESAAVNPSENTDVAAIVN
jgi:very-short-patch-repair endonuclease